MSFLSLLPSILGAGATIYGTAANNASINKQLNSQFTNSLQSRQHELEMMQLNLENTRLLNDQEDEQIAATNTLVLQIMVGVAGMALMGLIFMPGKKK